MLFLMANVARYVVNHGGAHGERAVPALPGEICRDLRLPLEPFARFNLAFLDDLHYGELAAEANQGVDVIFDSANDQRRRVDVVAQDRRHVGVELIAHVSVAEPRRGRRFGPMIATSSPRLSAATLWLTE